MMRRATARVAPTTGRGDGFYKDLALRVGQMGIRALAFDYFGRTAGTGARDDAFDFAPHVQAMTFPFYSGFSRPVAGADGATLDQAKKIRVPVLGLYGGADQGIPVSDVERLDKELDVAGVEYEIHVYPGAPHSFFDRKMAEFVEESADAWTRVLNFIHAHSKN